MDGYYDYDTGGRSPRRTAVVAAVAAVALCIAFLIGYASHGGPRAAANPGRSSPGPTQASAIPATPAGAASPSPAGTLPATATRGPLSRNSAGVIVRYSREQAGAVAAAGNYTGSLYVQTNRTHARELTVLSTIAASQADAVRMAGDFSTEDGALAKLLDVADLQSPGVIAYGHPLGYRVESCTAAAATVDVYVTGGQGVADAPDGSSAAGETFYEVDQVELVWRQGDWRMKNWSHLVESNGPELATVAAESYLPFPIGQAGT